jgi:DNA-binding response OmpR family regulator
MMADLRILVVEDDPDGADMVSMMLQSTGVEAVVSHDAETALGWLQSDPGYFNAAIIDLALPGMDGMELMGTIRNTPEISRLPMIAVTAFHTPELKVRVLDSGFDAYFPKPLDTNLFLRNLERVLMPG